MLTSKKNIVITAIILALFIGGFFAYSMMSPDSNKNANKITANLIGVSAQSDDIYKMFLCPCCGQVLDKNNICCGMATEMINFIDSLIASGISNNEVIIKTAEKYGINSVVESKRAEVQAEMEKRNPSAFPEGKLSFISAIGQKAPDFSLESIGGTTIKLSDYKGKNVVLFFTEGSMCYPACWDQMSSFGNDERLNNDDVVVFSITPDQKKEWQKIIQKVPKMANARILFDSTRAVSSAYDVLSLASSMHKGSYPGHTYFIIDKKGIIRYTLDDPQMAIRNEQIVSEINKLA
ncbi:redoxin domain-containing protein [Candidatus Woesearchaeota archaeon]|nr:redoxin domain-containing protein [Candidatus Woesearchaeota archaeon]